MFLSPRTLCYQNPLSTEELLGKRLQTRERWWVLSGRESLPRTTEAKIASSLHINHRRQYWTPKDPEVGLAAELGLWVHKLHEGYPGARTQAPRQEGVQSGCRCCQYQLNGDKLACANSAIRITHYYSLKERWNLKIRFRFTCYSL